MKASELDRKFDDGESVTDKFDHGFDPQTESGSEEGQC